MTYLRRGLFYHVLNSEGLLGEVSLYSIIAYVYNYGNF